MHAPWRERDPVGYELDEAGISTSVSKWEAYELAHIAKGRRVLEVGSAFGFTSCVMGLTARRVLAIDPHNWLNSWEKMTENLRTYGVTETVQVMASRSNDVYDALIDGEMRFDFAFIDGDHRYDAVKYDVEGALKMLVPGSMLACHDYEETCCCPDVKVALNGIFPDGPKRVVDTLAIYEVK